MSETKKLYRSQTNSVIGGVCAGLAEYLAVDPVLVRLVFVALALVNGLGVLGYFVMWLLVPEKSKSDLTGEEAFRANMDDIGQRARNLGTSFKESGRAGILVGVALIVMGGLFLLKDVVPWFSPALFWPVVLIFLGAYLLLARR